MLPDIVSVYTKVLSNRCSVTFLHDSIHCQHCLNGGIHLVSRHKKQQDTEEDTTDSAPRESLIREARLRGLVIKQDSIPESCFSPMGIKVNETVIAHLKKVNERPHNSEQTEEEQNKKRNALSRLVKRNVLLKDGDSSCTYYKNNDGKNCAKAKCSETLKKSFYNRLFPNLPVPILKAVPKCKKKAPKKDNVIKKQATPKVTKVNKEPTKGTLKRKRWQMNKLIQKDQDYEDDIFENTEFSKFEGLIQEDSDSENYEGMITPKISLSPVRDGSSTPSYDDCYSPNELFTTRKEAEEYIYRREKRRKMKILRGEYNSEDPPEVQKNSEEYTRKTLQETCKILSKAIRKEDDNDSDNPEDYYFSDVSENAEENN